MMKNRKMAIALACFAIAFSGSAVFAQTFKQGDILYTLTNIHYEKGQMSAVNFQFPDFIPAGTAVKVVFFEGGNFGFKVISTKKTFYYGVNKQAGEPQEEHLKKVFTASWDPATVTSMSEIDQKGIAEGKAFVGMTRKGVIIALGNPPRVQNPSLTEGNWVYWKTRYNRIKVEFDENGIVTGIVN